MQNLKLIGIFLIFILALGLTFSAVNVLAEKGGNSGKSSGDDSDEDNPGNGNSNKGGNNNDNSDDSGDEDNDENDDNDSDDDEDDEDDSDEAEASESEIKIKRKTVDENGNKVEIEIKIKEEIENGVLERKISVKEKSKGSVEASTKLEIKESGVPGGESIIKAILSDGNEVDINVLPDKIKEFAEKILTNENISIELNEVVEDGKTKAVFSTKTTKEGKVFGIFKAKLEIEAQIDPETGELIKVKKPWWAFLVAGEDKVVICHIPPGNPDNKHTITIGAPSVKAHLAHGDVLEACPSPIPPGNETNPPGNETIPPGNQTTNLTLTILSPQNITYNVTEIPITLSSNGDNIWYIINSGNATPYNSSINQLFEEGTNTLTAFANNTFGEEISDSVIFSIDLNSTIIVIPPGNETSGNETVPGNETNSSV